MIDRALDLAQPYLGKCGLIVAVVAVSLILLRLKFNESRAKWKRDEEALEREEFAANREAQIERGTTQAQAKRKSEWIKARENLADHRAREPKGWNPWTW